MDDPLETYLNDHLAGATAAVALIEGCRERYAEEPLGAFFADLLVEVERDEDTLRNLIERAGGTVRATREAAGWLLEKASRAKLRGETGLDLLESLDGLSLGVEGKRALWTALEAAFGGEGTFEGIDFGTLKRRAERQHAAIEEHRFDAARRAFLEASAR
jgi:hypothetical protein